MNIALGDSIDNDATITFDGPNHRDNAWLTVNLGPGRPAASIVIIATDEGLVIDVYSLDREDDMPVASTYAFDTDLEPELGSEEGRPIFVDEARLIDPALLGTQPIFIDEIEN